MMSRRIYHISLLTAWAVAALLLSACSADGNSELAVPDVERQPVVFSATMADGQTETATRTVQGVIDEAGLKTSAGFGVFACYTGLRKYGFVDAQPDFMYNEQVTWNDGTGKWGYSPLKYWPNGEGVVDGSTGDTPHYLSFMAYAPYSDMSTGDAGYCISSMSYQHEVGNPWITYRLHSDVTRQVDLLCAAPLIDQTKNALNTPLTFAFQHALACAGNKLTVKCSDVMKNTVVARPGTGVSKVEVQLTALTIDYTLTEKARLVLWNNGTPNWQTINSGQTTTTRHIDYAPADYVLHSDGSSSVGYDYENDDKGVFYIPVHLGGHPQTAVITLTYQVVRYATAAPTIPIVERTRTVSTTLTLSDYADAYQPGKTLDYVLTIHDNTLTLTAGINNWTNVSQGNFVAE